MSESKQTAKVGELVKVKAGATVVRPDGSENTVGEGGYVLDVPGVFVVDGTEVTVK